MSLPRQKVQVVPISTNLTISEDLAASFTFDVTQKQAAEEFGPHFGSLAVGQFSAGPPTKGTSQPGTIPGYIIKVNPSHYASVAPRTMPPIKRDNTMAALPLHDDSRKYFHSLKCRIKYHFLKKERKCCVFH